MEEVAPGTVVGVEAVGIAVVVVEVVGTDLAEELVLGTVVEVVLPEESSHCKTKAWIGIFMEA